MLNNNKKRVTVTVSNELYELLKRESDLTGLSVQSVLVFYAVEHIKQNNMINQLPSMIDKAVSLNDSVINKNLESK